tara:strand:- start:402 stop:644 length:243 start_codon:yes stop_codon:yes gene_type:complete
MGAPHNTKKRQTFASKDVIGCRVENLSGFGLYKPKNTEASQRRFIDVSSIAASGRVVEEACRLCRLNPKWPWLPPTFYVA